MYKVDLKTLNEITETLDAFNDVDFTVRSNYYIIKLIKLREKAENLSQKIKDEYTQIKK